VPIAKPPFPRLNLQHPLGKNLTGAWLMYERAGTRVNDLTDYRNHGTMNGGANATWANNAHGAAFGVNNEAYLSIPHSAKWNATNLSIVLGVEFNTVKSGTLLQHQNSGTFGGFELSYYTTDSTLKFLRNGNDVVISKSWVPVTGVTYVLAVTKNTVTNTWELFVDGRSIGTNTDANNVNPVTGIMALGRWSNGSFYSHADYSFLYTWDRWLKPLEMRQISQNPWLFTTIDRYPWNYLTAAPDAATLIQRRMLGMRTGSRGASYV
jgi:hypothetical protein